MTWLPALILVVIITAIVLTTVAVQNSWWAHEAPAASSDQKASDGSSMLTDAGFDYANVEGVVRVRIGEAALAADEFGMGTDARKSAEFRRPLRVVVAANDEVYVVDDVAALDAVTKDGALASVTLVFDNPETWADAVSGTRALADTYGWDAAQIDALDDELAEFNRSGTGEVFAAVVGPSTGAASVTATLSFDRASGTTLLVLTFEPTG